MQDLTPFLPFLTVLGALAVWIVAKVMIPIKNIFRRLRSGRPKLAGKARASSQDSSASAFSTVSRRSARRFDRSHWAGTSCDVVGIDLGTTRSKIAAFHQGHLGVVPDRYGNLNTPSLVLLTDYGDFYVGHEAKEHVRRYEYTHLLVGSIKRSVLKLGSTTWKGRRYYPQVLFALVLANLKRHSESQLGRAISHAVLSVPASFGQMERQMIKDAGRIAGLEVLRLLNEPTAAALAYAPSSDGTMLIYDLGGGTFDVSVVEVCEGVMEVKATAGNMELGGQDYDDKLTGYLIQEIERIYKIDIRMDEVALARLREAAEQAKITLSFQECFDLEVPYLFGQQHFQYTLRRSIVDDLTKGITSHTIKLCQQLLETAHLKMTDLDGILLVGGQTRMPQVREAVRAELTHRIVPWSNPEDLVAEGTAIYGAVMRGQIKDVLLLDVLSKSLGTQVANGQVTHIIEKNTTLPTRKSKTFTTTTDNQRSVSFDILEGENAEASKSRLLGTMTIDGIPAAKAGVPQIEVSFSVDANGIIEIKGRDLGTGRQQDLRIESPGALTEADIRSMTEMVSRWIAAQER